MKKTIVIGQTKDGPLHLDLAVLMKTRLLIQANSGGGKSFLIRRLAEQLFGTVPVIIVDPEGEFATLREKFGYVLVGKGGETPADPRSAKLVAHKLLELRASAVIDLYEMNPRDRHHYVRLFAEAMIDAPKNLWQPTVIIFDESHNFAPEKGSGESEASDAVTSFPTRGRKRRFCCVFATQRLGKLRKDASAELLNRLVGPTFEDVDLKRAADLLSVTGEDRREFDQQMRVMEPGNFFAFGRALCKERTLVKVGPVETSHEIEDSKFGSAPPPTPEKIKALLPKLADLPKQAEEIARSEAELRKEIVTLKRDLAAAKAAQPQAEVKNIEVAVVRDSDLVAVKNAADMFQTMLHEITKARDCYLELSAINGHLLALRQQPRKPFIGGQRVTRESAMNGLGDPAKWEKEARELKREFQAKPGDVLLVGGPKKVMIAIAQYPDGVASETIAVLTGYKSTSRYEFIRQLKAAEYVDEKNGVFVPTDAGIAALGSDFEPLPTGAELVEHWRRRLTGGELKIFEAAIEVYPEDMDAVQLQEITGMKSTSVYEYSRQLKARRLLVGNHGKVRATEELFE